MPKTPRANLSWKAALIASTAVLLSACGGGSAGSGGPISTPSPPPTPTPAPAPAPAPAPTPPPSTVNFDTAEYRRSDGPSQHDAIAAWEAGHTGRGSVIGVIDSGIDSDSPEFAGRIHPDSTDVVGNRAIDGDDDHGTNVALVAAAARDNTGMVGIAFDARVLALRADDIGSCGPDTPQDASLGCLFDDRSIAAGIDVAIRAGADVINISLGGGPASQVVLDAVRRASQAGIVIVVSAGNAGDGSDPAIDPNQPDPFATSLLRAGSGNVIIAGSVDATGAFSDFSNRAGADAASFLTARGEGVCCVYDNGRLFIETIDGQQYVTLFSGTSFSAPQVAGAVALLAQAFPNLTGQQIVEILLTSATDAGAVGQDTTFGRGILNIGAALRPIGRTAMAGTNDAIALFDDVAIGSAPMGDALDDQPIDAVVLDKYERAYSYNLGAGMASAREITPRLYQAVNSAGRTHTVTGANLSMAYSIADGSRAAGLEWSGPLRLSSDDADRAKLLAMQVAARIAPDTQLAFGLNQSADGLVARMAGGTAGASRSAFMLAPGGNPAGDLRQESDVSIAVRHDLGSWGASLAYDRGQAWLGANRRIGGELIDRREREDVQNITASFDRSWGDTAAQFGLRWMAEDRTVLGGFFHQSIAGGGADSIFAEAGLSHEFSPGWRAAAQYTRGITLPRDAALLASGSQLQSDAWSFDLVRSGVLGVGDQIGLRIAQPLRVVSGGLDLNLPVSYDYATRTASFATRTISLSPEGREVIGEINWRGPFLNGIGGAGLFYRRDPGHFADSPDDRGVVIRWGRSF